LFSLATYLLFDSNSSGHLCIDAINQRLYDSLTLFIFVLIHSSRCSATPLQTKTAVNSICLRTFVFILYLKQVQIKSPTSRLAGAKVQLLFILASVLKSFF